MSNTVLLWFFCPLLLFWGVGAYNRLVRLRAMAITAFAHLQSQYAQYVSFVQINFAVLITDERLSPRTSLVGAALQLEASLKVSNAHPLDSLLIRTLETAHETLQTAWVRVCSEAPDLAGDPLPVTLQKQWVDIALQAGHDRSELNLRIEDYNRGIQQFPANLLAWLFRLKPVYGEKDDA
jgi:LemA protein